METQKDAYKDYCPFKEGYLGFHGGLGECIGVIFGYKGLYRGYMGGFYCGYIRVV